LAPTALVGRTISYLPVGVSHALFAPFPWRADALSDRIASIEMPIWYVLLVAAVATTWRQRARLRGMILLVLYVLGVIAVLSLVEGNVGTLFRHRAMVIPTVIILAAPTLSRWLDILNRRFAPR
jgi:hypothetical protein